MSEGTLCVVTGATRGIGRAIALALAVSGRRVLAIGRDARAMARLVDEAGERVRALQADVTDPDSVAKVLEAAEGQGGASELVCSAGIIRHQPVGRIEPSALREQLAVNLEAPLLLGQALGERMAAAGAGGAIVFVSSNLTERPAPGTTAYAATKAGLEAAARGLALELAPADVRVNVVAPGVVDTEMIRRPRGDGLDGDARVEQLRQLHPLGRVGRPEDVAQAVLYLLDAPWVTGSVLRIDGGLTIR